MIAPNVPQKDALWTMFLWMGLGAAWAMRLLFPQYLSPMDHLWSDPLRHWDNAREFTQNRFFAGIDPKGYQWFLAKIYAAWEGARAPTEWAVGVQCWLTGIFWFLAARELLSQRAAILTGIVLSIMPSLLVIFGYFMSETLLLTLLGMAWWLSLLTWRKRSVVLFFITIAAWWATILTRVIVLPIGLGMMVFLWWMLPHKKWTLLVAIVISLNLLHPAAEFSKERINVYTPFSYGMLNKIYVRSNHRVIEIGLPNGVGWGFESPTFYTKPLEPFSDYQMLRKEGSYRFVINTMNGEKDWQKAYDEVSQNYHWNDYLNSVRDNLLYTLFARSWPDSTIDEGQPWVLSAGAYNSWLWAPLILLILTGFFFAKLPPRQAVFLAATTAIFVMLVVQNSGIMEGRYRKPLEPMLIISVVILCTQRKRDESAKTMIEHAKYCLTEVKKIANI
jgi:hypothetical protein